MYEVCFSHVFVFACVNGEYFFLEKFIIGLCCCIIIFIISF